MTNAELNKWASAIANRIADEWSGAQDFPYDARKLRSFLEKSLRHDRDAVKLFIGTGIIESDYFEAHL